MEVPNRDVAQRELKESEGKIPFHLKEWPEFERWLGWKIYTFSLAMLTESNDEQRAILHGRARMCEEILKMGAMKKKDLT